MTKEIQSRLRDMIEERDQGHSELREEFDKSRADDASVSRENEHLKDSYVGQKTQGDDRAQEKTRVEQDRPEPRPTPPRGVGPIQDRITEMDRLSIEQERAAQEKDQDREMEMGDEERSRDEER
jgi:hypothetical protein